LLAERRETINICSIENIGQMSVIMGGSGSTGSSLVKNILNRHPDVYSGEETSFFAKKLIYDDWSRAKKKVTQRKLRGLRNHGFHIYNGTDFTESEYLRNNKEIQQLAYRSDSLLEFSDMLYDKAIKKRKAKFWLEKTPANAACFSLFLDRFEDGNTIHMVRNPFDTIASLWARGYDLYYAVGIYLLNTSSALSARRYDDRYTELKYEDVISNPEKSVSELCHFLGISFQSEMLQSQNEDIEVSQLSSWKYDETANIGKQAHGRFGKLPTEQRQQIIEAVNLIKVSETGKSFYDVELTSIKEICEVLDYEFHESKSEHTLPQLRKERRKDRALRIKRGYKTGFYYPLDLLK